MYERCVVRLSEKREKRYSLVFSAENSDNRSNGDKCYRDSLTDQLNRDLGSFNVFIYDCHKYNVIAGKFVIALREHAKSLHANMS